MLIVSINNTWVRLWLKKPEEERQDKKAENEGLQDEREIYGTTFSFVKNQNHKKKTNQIKTCKPKQQQHINNQSKSAGKIWHVMKQNPQVDCKLEKQKNTHTKKYDSEPLLVCNTWNIMTK